MRFQSGEQQQASAGSGLHLSSNVDNHNLQIEKSLSGVSRKVNVHV